MLKTGIQANPNLLDEKRINEIFGQQLIRNAITIG
jgi:hypothetical protein